MYGVPALSFREVSDYNYNRAWHTVRDTFNEVVPYTEHQQEAALVTAVIAYGVANLDKQLPREGIYYPDGMFAEINTAKGMIVTTLDFANAPLYTADFIRIVEGPNPPQPGAQGRAAGGGGGARGGPGGAPQAPPIGKIIDVAANLASGSIESDLQKSVPAFTPLHELNTVMKHDAPGVLGMTGQNQFYLTLKSRPDLDPKYPIIGKVIAGASVLEKLTKDDAIRNIIIRRIGKAATDFKTDTDSFQKLLAEKAKILAPVKAPAKKK
jgi:cyclophilin family peptidyl-prolyl cis-trans isomerase